MNRLTVYSYLTRYTYGHAEAGSLFTEPLPGKSKFVIKKFLDKARSSRYHDQLARSSGQARTDKVTQQAGRQAGPLSLDLTSGWMQPESDNKRREGVQGQFGEN